MENLWKNLDLIKSGIENPKQILEKQITYLNEAMDGLIEASFESATFGPKTQKIIKDNKLDNDFSYGICLESNYVEDYSYHLLAITYGIKFYPLCIIVSDGIAEELERKLGSELDDIKLDLGRYLIKSQEEFLNILSHILNSNELMTILQNLKNLAESEKESSFRF